MDSVGRTLSVQITLPRWIYRAVENPKEILSISPLYFEPTGATASSISWHDVMLATASTRGEFCVPIEVDDLLPWKRVK